MTIRGVAGRLVGAGTLRWSEAVGELTASWRVLPDFLILGTQRGGTASLYYNLAGHPSVGPATRKEVHFFDLRYPRGLAWYRSHFPTRADLQERRRRTGAGMTGEASPYYLFHPAVPSRVRAALPEVKCIVLLRNPVDRAYSHYQREVRKGREPLSFEDAVAAETNRLRGEAERIQADAGYVSERHQQWSYLARGIYLPQVQAWMAALPRERFLVLESEAFFADPASALRQVASFLGLPSHPAADIPAYNAQHYAEMPPTLRRQLEAFFAPHNAALQAFLGRGFSWGPP